MLRTLCSHSLHAPKQNGRCGKAACGILLQQKHLRNVKLNYFELLELFYQQHDENLQEIGLFWRSIRAPPVEQELQRSAPLHTFDLNVHHPGKRWTL